MALQTLKFSMALQCLEVGTKAVATLNKHNGLPIRRIVSKMTSEIMEPKIAYSDHSSGESMLDQLAAFVVGTCYEDLSVMAIHQAKIRILDALACAIGALDGDPIKLIQAQII
jgi:hypothetical protein